MIRFEQVSKTFPGRAGAVRALQEVSLEIDNGDIFGVIGFSGAGKSTLLRLVNALERPTSGKVVVNGENINSLPSRELRRMRKRIAMVFQQFNLLESKTVYDNIALPLRLNRTPKDQIQRKVCELLEFVGLSDKRDAYPGKLSGGQKQRVGIARALATDPTILLCDEPTSALDPKTTDSILQLLEKVNRELNITILLITHEISVIRKICNKVAVMENGRVVESGSVLEVFGHPTQPITQAFVRTVIDDRIPDSIAREIRADNRPYSVIKMRFLGANARDSLISAVNKRFAVETTILFASVNELQHTVLGILVLQLVGAPDEIQKVKAYVHQSGVELEEVQV